MPFFRESPFIQHVSDFKISFISIGYLTWLDHGIQSHHFMGNRRGNSGNSVRLYYFGLQNHLQMVIAVMKLKDAYSLEGKL